MEKENIIEEFDINKLIEQEYNEFIEGSESDQDFLLDDENDESRERGGVKKVHKKRREGKSLVFNVTEKRELFEYLLTQLADRSRTTVKSYLTNRQISINDVITTQYDARLKPGDVVTINLGTAQKEFRHPMLKIIYEDDHLLVVDKKYGLLTMATDRERTKTAYYILSNYLKSKNPSNRIFIVHRLDRETSGLLLFAKSIEVQHELQKNWNDNVLERKYVAVIEGFPQQDEGLIECYLAENSAYNVYVTKNKEEGELAVTGYRVIRKGKTNSLVELELETGKKNQIRVHMKYIGHPIIGDRKYDGQISSIGRIALQASMIRFIHPVTGKEMSFDIGIPTNFISILNDKPIKNKQRKGVSRR